MELTSDYRTLLKSELENRMAKNAAYSQRAFARDLGLTSSGLSEIFSGKRGISRDVAATVARRLSWSAFEVEHFCDLVEAKHARSAAARELADSRVRERLSRKNAPTQLSADAFRTVRDWYHFAILAALDLKEARGTIAGVAALLEVPETQIDLAMGRLERLGLVVVSRSGKYRCMKDAVFSTDGVPSEAIRFAQEQLLRKASQALQLQPISERDFFSFIMPIRGADLPKIRARIRKCITQIQEDFSNHPEVDRVVTVSNQIFNLSRIPPHESETP